VTTSKDYQSVPGKLIESDESQHTLIQHQKDALLPSLLFVTRKLGEVEGILSVQSEPETALIGIQGDLKRLYDKLVDDVGIELSHEPLERGIGKDGV
jgi:hypothetical protein